MLNWSEKGLSFEGRHQSEIFLYNGRKSNRGPFRNGPLFSRSAAGKNPERMFKIKPVFFNSMSFSIEAFFAAQRVFIWKEIHWKKILCELHLFLNFVSHSSVLQVRKMTAWLRTRTQEMKEWKKMEPIDWIEVFFWLASWRRQHWQHWRHWQQRQRRRKRGVGFVRNLFLAPKVNFFLIESRSELEKDETVYCLFVCFAQWWLFVAPDIAQGLTGSMESCLEQLIWFIVWILKSC